MLLSSLNIYIDSKLPNEQTIRDIELQIPLKIFSSDGKLIGEFGEQRRTALNFNEIPDHYINAVLAAEDDNFSHSGVSYSGLLRSLYSLQFRANSRRRKHYNNAGCWELFNQQRYKSFPKSKRYISSL